MKNAILLIIAFTFSLLLSAQKVTKFEYFFDTEPGVGNGATLGVTNETVVEVDYTIDLSSLSTGVHTLYFRAKDNTGFLGLSGNWGLASGKSFYLQRGYSDVKLQAIEYFFDSLPVSGTGTIINFADTANIDQEFVLNLSGLKTGTHTLYIRAKDNCENWSTLNQKVFMVFPWEETPKITTMEYFFNADPGRGNGVQIAITPIDTVDQIFEIDCSSLAVGVNNLYTRVKDAQGNWSMTHSGTFYCLQGNKASKVSKMEYFWDTDPGFDNAIPVHFTPNDTVSTTFQLFTHGLEAGDHIFCLRACDDAGNWSVLNEKIVSINTPVITSVPNGLMATAFGPQNIALSWDKTDGAINYRLLRGTSLNGFFKQIYWANGNKYDDCGTHLLANTTYYYKVCTENQAGLSDTTNAISVTTLSTSTEVILADLKSPSLKIESPKWEIGSQQSVLVSFANVGKSASTPFIAKLHLMQNKNFSDATQPIDIDIYINSLAPDELIEQEIELNVPELTSGIYYLGVQVDPDNEVREIDNSNNFQFSTKRVIIDKPSVVLPDLTGEIACLAKQMQQGEALTAKVQIRNIGSASANTFKGRYYLSTNVSVDNTDIEIGDVIDFGTLGSYEKLDYLESEMLLPADIPVGVYKLLFLIDSDETVTEVSKINNTIIYESEIRVLESGGYIVSGKIIDIGKTAKTLGLITVGLEGVLIDGLPGTIITDSNGDFFTTVPTNWSGEIKPLMTKASAFDDDYFFFTSSGHKTITIDNITSNETCNFESVNVTHLANNILDKTKLLRDLQVIELSAEIEGTLETALLSNKYLGMYNEINDYYDILFEEHSSNADINLTIKSLKLMQKATKYAGPLGTIISAYFVIGEKILEEIDEISDNVWATRFPGFFMHTPVEIDMEITNPTLWVGPYSPTHYFNRFNASLIIYDKNNPDLNATIDFDKEIIDSKIKLTAQKHFQALNSTIVGVPFDDLELTLKIEWLDENNPGEKLQDNYYPMREPYISQGESLGIGFVFNLDLSCNLRTVFSNEHIEVLKLK